MITSTAASTRNVDMIWNMSHGTQGTATRTFWMLRRQDMSICHPALVDSESGHT